MNDPDNPRHAGLTRPPRVLSHFIPLVCGLLLLAQASTGNPQEVVKLKPDSGPWRSEEGFQFEKKRNDTRRSVSGIACPRGSLRERVCLVVFDEGTQARFLTLRDDAFEPLPERVLLSKTDGELDAEGAATDGDYFYITGSHSVKRTTCESNPHGRRVLRLPVDAATGRVLRDAGSTDDASSVYMNTDLLWLVMQSLDGLRDHAHEDSCLGTEPPPKAPNLVGRNGVNIEGLAVRHGRLYFGFRGPSVGGVVPVLGMDATAFFAKEDAKPKITRVAVGIGRGIRDFTAVGDGVLLLTGPDDNAASEKTEYAVHFWNAQENGSAVVAPPKLAVLDLEGVALSSCDRTIKPEAMAVLEEMQDYYRVLVMSDGMCDGGPLIFKLPRH